MTDRDDRVPARCPSGHPVRWCGNPFMVKRGTTPQVWGSPVVCGECGRTLGVQ